MMTANKKREIVENALAKGNGILRLEPAWVARDFLPPGRRLGLKEEESTRRRTGVDLGAVAGLHHQGR